MAGGRTRRNPGDDEVQPLQQQNQQLTNEPQQQQQQQQQDEQQPLNDGDPVSTLVHDNDAPAQEPLGESAAAPAPRVDPPQPPAAPQNDEAVEILDEFLSPAEDADHIRR